MPSRWTAKTPMSGYVVAIAATLAIVLFRFLLSSLIGDAAFFFPFVIAVTLSAWYGGLKPGLLAPPECVTGYLSIRPAAIHIQSSRLQIKCRPGFFRNWRHYDLTGLQCPAQGAPHTRAERSQGPATRKGHRTPRPGTTRRATATAPYNRLDVGSRHSLHNGLEVLLG